MTAALLGGDLNIRDEEAKKTGKGGMVVDYVGLKWRGFLKHPKYIMNLESNSIRRSINASIDIIVIQVNQTSRNTYLKVTYR